jgi:hypothetical protein
VAGACESHSKKHKTFSDEYYFEITYNLLYNAQIGHSKCKVIAKSPTSSQIHENCHFVFKISCHDLSDDVSNRCNITQHKHFGKDAHILPGTGSLYKCPKGQKQPIKL